MKSPRLTDTHAVDAMEASGGELRRLLSEATRRSLVPLVVLLPLAIVCWQASEARPLGTLTLAIYVAVAGLLIACEYALAFDEDWGTAVKGKLTDFLYVGAASGVEKATFLLCAAIAAGFGRLLSTSFEVSLWPSHWNFALQVVLAIAIADVGTYFRHRLFHIFPLLWRFHRIHHSMTGLYWIRSAYTHPLEQFAIMLAIMFPIALLGASDSVIVVIAFVYGLSGLLQHANIDARSSFLNCVFATPEVHRFHHGANERGNASNFSAFFVFMDILFGTYCRPERHEAPRVVGLEGVKAFPSHFLKHLVLPFQRDPAGIEVDAEWAKRQAELSHARQP
jgi:sterol desaturase/sphingolipid hydroxylase (fatty acid hydroxylase superfamily)